MIPLNVQPIEKMQLNDEGVLQVFKIWYTIQGEGPFTGKNAVFIRLAGCNLQCPHCDTDYTSNRWEMTPRDILANVKKTIPFEEDKSQTSNMRRRPVVVITGGEPFRQNIEPLCSLLVREGGYTVQIETNGTIYPLMMEQLAQTHGMGNSTFLRHVHIVCSPKTPKLNAFLQDWIDSYKYVISHEAVDERDGLPSNVLGTGNAPARPHAAFYGDIYLQPEDTDNPEKNEANVQAAKESCLKFGYRLSLQTHKIIGVE